MGKIVNLVLSVSRCFPNSCLHSDSYCSCPESSQGRKRDAQIANLSQAVSVCMAKIARHEAALKTGNGLQLEAMKNEQAKMKTELKRLQMEQKRTAEELEDVSRQGRKLILTLHGFGESRNLCYMSVQGPTNRRAPEKKNG